MPNSIYRANLKTAICGVASVPGSLCTSTYTPVLALSAPCNWGFLNRLYRLCFLVVSCVLGFLLNARADAVALVGVEIITPQGGHEFTINWLGDLPIDYQVCFFFEPDRVDDHARNCYRRLRLVDSSQFKRRRDDVLQFLEDYHKPDVGFMAERGAPPVVVVAIVPVNEQIARFLSYRTDDLTDRFLGAAALVQMNRAFAVFSLNEGHTVLQAQKAIAIHERWQLAVMRR